MDTDFGARLTEIMKRKNISNTELTEKAQLSKNNIGNYKNGQIPNATILYNLSQILGVSMEYLIAGKEGKDLTPEEQKLVDYYRKADERGKRNIIRTAEQECQELEYTTSKIG